MLGPDTTRGSAPPGLIFAEGQIHTVNARNDIGEAVAVGGEAVYEP
jgi:predicted amidohydrolase YtcJ